MIEENTLNTVNSWLGINSKLQSGELLLTLCLSSILNYIVSFNWNI